MRERVAVTAPEATPAIWAGTFHAFGLELLHKYGHLPGLPTEVRLVDPGDALLLLEEMLPSLPLNHYLRLCSREHNGIYVGISVMLSCSMRRLV